ATAAAGCSSSFLMPRANPKVKDELSQMVYPAKAPFGDDIDVVLVRDGRRFELINRTARDYPPGIIWLNQQWAGHSEEIKIGRGNNSVLTNFVNKHGEPSPTGSLLNPEASRNTLLAELYDPAAGKRYRMVARQDVQNSATSKTGGAGEGSSARGTGY